MQELLTNTKKSQELFKRACKVIPGGVNSPLRSFKAVELEPLFISKAKGAYIWDVDQNQYLDYVQSWGTLIHGHAQVEIINTLEKAISKGTSYGTSHENEIELAEIIIENFPSIEKIRFVNSGTEAVMTAIRLARAFTKKNKIIKFDGCYHGHSDSVLIKSGSGVTTLGIPICPGITKNTGSETISLPYNDTHQLDITLSKFPNQIAAVIVEPIVGNCGVILPKEGFLKSIQELTQKIDSLVIFDEVITGFRIGTGGAQLKYNINPDITILGKIIGGGMPIGALGGKKEIMDLLAPLGPVYQAGTFSSNPISMACGLATLKLLFKENYYEYLDYLTNTLCEEIEKINKHKGINVQVNKACSMFSIFFTKSNVTNYQTAIQADTKKFARYFKSMLSNGIYLAPSQFEANFISTAHKEQDINKTIEAHKKSIEDLNNLD